MGVCVFAGCHSGGVQVDDPNFSLVFSVVACMQPP